MLRVHFSNRMEVLLHGLRQLLAAPAGVEPDPFAPQEIVVQNNGMARWLAQRLAAADGIAANLAFPLPASFFWRVFRAWFPDLPERTAFDRDGLAWQVYARLPARLSEPAFAEPAGYLRGEPAALKRWQLARRIADVFDQYLVYRPDMLRRWEAGKEDHWQAQLWRELAGLLPGPHRALLLEQMQQAAREGSPPAAPALLPARIALFGLSALPPPQCALLELVGRHCDVHLFVLNPCREYWADIVDERGRSRRRARALAKGQPDPGALLDLGNPLLAALGHTGQSFVDQTLELDDDPVEAFADPDGATLLATLQQHILDLTDPSDPDPALRHPLDPDDDSLLVHVCHSPLREVQVLHDRLLALFEALPGLTPRDVIVMAPDIDAYAPFIEAVFGAVPPERRIPWSIADRRLGQQEPLLTALSELLALPLSRLGASEVLGWLEVPAIARRLRLDEADLARIRQWVAESGIRWGLDGAMRDALALPDDDSNSWAFGLRRLFLGYALPPEADLYRGTLPYADLEGGDAVALGALSELIAQLGHWRRVLARPHTAAGWRRQILALTDALFAPDEDEDELLQRVREAMDDFAAQAAAAGLDDDADPNARLTPDILRAHLAEVIDTPLGGQRFLTGAVTCCNMVPMRSIPARVLCLLGMNGDAFPRGQRPVGFDLMPREPRPGDRSRRDDDRYLFLEALISARDRLHLSYVGRDLRDNGVKVPSVVLDELLEVIDRGFLLAGEGTPDARRPSRHLLVEHPLQPFSTRCFDGVDPRLHSFDSHWLAVSRAAAAPPPPPFADGPLPPAEVSAGAEPDCIELAELARFLYAPARWFLQQRLRLRLPWDEREIADEEPFGLAGLARWQVAERLLAEDADAPRDQSLARLRAAGVLPHGEAGEMLCAREADRVQVFRAALARLDAPALQRLELDLPLPQSGVRLQGWLDGVTEAGLIAHRLGRRRAKDLLGLWLRHLALAALAPRGVCPASRYLTEGKDGPELTELRAPAEPLALLDHLAGLLLAARAQPQPLFPECGLVWAETQDQDKLLRAWEGDPHRGFGGEGSDQAVQIAFRGHPEPLGAGFQALSLAVFSPLLAAMAPEDAS